MFKKIVVSAALLLTMTGCTNLMTIGSPEYACKGMPEGVSCMSAKDVFAATEGDNYRTQLKSEQEAASNRKKNSEGVGEPETRILYAEGGDNAPIPARARNPLPIRTQAVVMRIAIDPWEDENGDLYVPGFIYTEIEPRRWEIGARQEYSSKSLIPLIGK